MRQSKAVQALGVSIGFLAIAMIPVLMFYFIWLQWTTNEQAKSVLLANFDKFRAVASYDPQNLATDPNPAIPFLGEGSSTGVTATLQAKIRELAAQRGVDVIQAADLPQKTLAEGLTQLGIRLDMAGPPQGVFAVLQQIEEAVPWLFVDNIQLRQNYVDTNAQTEPTMALSLEVWGIVPAPAPASSEAVIPQ